MVKTENIQITYLSQIDSIRQLMIQDDYLAACNLITESPILFLKWLLVEFRVRKRFGRTQVKINGIYRIMQEAVYNVRLSLQKHGYVTRDVNRFPRQYGLKNI